MSREFFRDARRQRRQSNQNFVLHKLGNEIWTLSSEYNGQSVVVGNSPNENGAPIIQYDVVTGVQAQIFLQPSTDNTFKLIFATSGKCVDVRDWATWDGAVIQQWDCHGGANQDWYIRPASL